MSRTPEPITLNDGHPIPRLGLGVWQMTDEQATASVTYALEADYRSIDTASIYENEAGVGVALAQTAVPRSELFVTTKVWNDDQGYASTLRACELSLKRLRLDYLDLYLIHWPAARDGKFVDTFKAMQKLRDDGLVRSIGVSNFTPGHLHTIIQETGEVPAINQVELHPRLSQTALRAFHAQHGIITEAYSPLGQGAILADPVIAQIAVESGCTTAQVVLSWHLSIGNVVIPKSATPQRIADNLAAAEITLTVDQLDRIAVLDNGTRIGADPDIMW